jgi:hypothetical protein
VADNKRFLSFKSLKKIFSVCKMTENMKTRRNIFSRIMGKLGIFLLQVNKEVKIKKLAFK